MLISLSNPDISVGIIIIINICSVQDQPRASFMLDKHSTMVLHPSP
jgi:hypothetical protein